MTNLSPSPSPTPSNTDAQSPSISKRKRSSTTASDVSLSSSPKRRSSHFSSQPPPAPLPPPIIPYPQHPISAHPHLVPFYPVYTHHPLYIPLPASSSPTNTPTTPGEQPRANLAPSPIPQQPTPPGYYHSAAVATTTAATTTTTTSSTLYGHHPPSPSSRPTTADEREQARRVSHSAIERRRRERINDKIVQLRQLIPSCADQEHLNKMTILQSAIDYITHLKKIVESKDGSNAESLKLDNLKIQSPRSMVPKEVTPFTTQFTVNPQPPPTPPSATETPAIASPSSLSVHTKGIKPMDIIDARKNGLGKTLSSSRQASARTEEAGTGNMSVDAMLCGK